MLQRRRCTETWLPVLVISHVFRLNWWTLNWIRLVTLGLSQLRAEGDCVVEGYLYTCCCLSDCSQDYTKTTSQRFIKTWDIGLGRAASLEGSRILLYISVDFPRNIAFISRNSSGTFRELISMSVCTLVRLDWIKGTKLEICCVIMIYIKCFCSLRNSYDG